jgi:hypothetical protein
MPSHLKYETAVENVALPVIFLAYGVCVKSLWPFFRRCHHEVPARKSTDHPWHIA